MQYSSAVQRYEPISTHLLRHYTRHQLSRISISSDLYLFQLLFALFFKLHLYSDQKSREYFVIYREQSSRASNAQINVTLNDRDFNMLNYLVSKKTMKINPQHSIVIELGRKSDQEYDNKAARDFVCLLFNIAHLAFDFSLEELSSFATCIHRMITLGLSIDDDKIKQKLSSSKNTFKLSLIALTRWRKPTDCVIQRLLDSLAQRQVVTQDHQTTYTTAEIRCLDGQTL